MPVEGLVIMLFIAVIAAVKMDKEEAKAVSELQEKE